MTRSGAEEDEDDDAAVKTSAAAVGWRLSPRHSGVEESSESLTDGPPPARSNDARKAPINRRRVPGICGAFRGGYSGEKVTQMCSFGFNYASSSYLIHFESDDDRFIRRVVWKVNPCF